MKKSSNQLGTIIKQAIDSQTFAIEHNDSTSNAYIIKQQLNNFTSFLSENNLHSVIINSPPCMESICLAYALITSERVYIPLNTSSSLHLQIKQLNNLGADALIVKKSLINKTELDSIKNNQIIYFSTFYIILKIKPANFSITPGLILYTTGSTGSPKAVFHNYNIIAEYITWGCKTFKLKSTDKFLFTTELSFIASFRPLFMAAGSLATIVLATKYNKYNTNEFWQNILLKKITILSLTPSYLDYLIKKAPSTILVNNDLRIIFLSGEPINIKTIKKCRRILGNEIDFFDLYGSTETIVPFYKKIPIDLIGFEAQTLGKLRDGCNYFLEHFVNEHYKLYLNGAVATAYFNDNLNKTSYINHNGKRYFLSDDLVIKKDNNLILTARKAEIIKYLGQKINLRQVQNIINLNNTITKSSLIYNNELNEIIAFVESTENPQSLKVDVNNLLKNNLPTYMHPHQIIILEKLPLNNHGKVDKKQLMKLNYVYEQTSLLSILKNLMSCQDLDNSTTIYSLNMSSLDYIQLTQQLMSHKKLYFDFSSINKDTTIKTLENSLHKINPPPLTSTKQISLKKSLVPLSKAQYYIATFNKNQITSPSEYYIHKYFLKMPIDLNRLEKAVIKTINSHFLLSCSLHKLNENLYFEHQPIKNKIILNKMTSWWYLRYKNLSTKLNDELLFRSYICHESNQPYLIFCFHHVISDGWSMWIVLSEVFKNYESDSYSPPLSFNSEKDLLLLYTQQENMLFEKNSKQPLTIPISFKYASNIKVKDTWHFKRTNSNDIHFSISNEIIDKFSRHYNLQKYKLSTVIIIIYYEAIKQLQNIKTLVLYITLSRRCLPIKNLDIMVAPCATMCPMIINDNSSITSQASEIEQDTQLLFNYANTNQIDKLHSTDQYKNIIEKSKSSVVFTYANPHENSQKDCSNYIDWNKSKFHLKLINSPAFFLRAYNMGEEILFSITSKAPKSITNKLSRILQDIINLKTDKD